MSSEQLCLKWNNFESNIASFLDILRNGNDFVDVTITCENTNFKAHKLILSACSPYFKGIFQDTPCQHPVIILKNVNCLEMEAILRYIYTGETHVSEENLQSFLQTANLLQIIGLAQGGDKPESFSRFGDELRGKWSKVRNNVSADGLSESEEKACGRQWSKGQDGDLDEIQARWRQSKSHSSFETSEDEGRGRKKSAESDGELPHLQRKTAEERKKLWAARCKTSPLKKRSVSENFSECDEDNHVAGEDQHASDEGDPCPILSKQLLLPKKRKVSSILDQNKNVELVSEHSDSSEADIVVKVEVQDDEEEEGSRSVLEPEVGLKEEGSDSEDSLPNGDILLQRLKGSDVKNDDSRILRVPNPDVSIFSQRLVHTGKDEQERERERIEHFTLAPNVDVFLRNSNNTENLLSKLSKINLFKAKRKGPRPEPCTSKAEEGKLHLTHLPCPHCSQLYNNLSALKYHVRLMHSDLENKLFCYLCPMNFIERDFFKMHLWEVHHARF